MEEIWKNVVGYEGVYQVSNLGNLKRLFKNKERMLSGREDKDGYIEVILSRKQSKKFCRLHRLVAEAFIPNIDNKPQVNHKDRNKKNNKVENLEWVTCSENTIHTFETGRQVRVKSIEQYSKDMKYIKEWESIKQASITLGISNNNISSCCSGKLGTAGGYIWKYKEV